MFPPSFFDFLEDRLNLAVYDTNEEHRLRFDLQRMSKSDLVKELDKGDVAAGTTDRTTEWVEDQVLEVNWPESLVPPVTFMPTEDLINEITKAPPMKLQGLAAKMAMLRHNLEAEAEKLGSRVDGAATKSTETFAKSHKFLDATDKDIADVESFIAELDAATNGGPAIEDPK